MRTRILLRFSNFVRFFWDFALNIYMYVVHCIIIIKKYKIQSFFFIALENLLIIAAGCNNNNQSRMSLGNKMKFHEANIKFQEAK
jgi:hypothetical protein